jgi:K+-transporting ATPase KdpF subunit
MNTEIFLAILPVHSDVSFDNDSVNYIIAGIIALLIMGYLFYSLFRPDKF